MENTNEKVVVETVEEKKQSDVRQEEIKEEIKADIQEPEAEKGEEKEPCVTEVPEQIGEIITSLARQVSNLEIDNNVLEDQLANLTDENKWQSEVLDYTEDVLQATISDKIRLTGTSITSKKKLKSRVEEKLAVNYFKKVFGAAILAVLIILGYHFVNNLIDTNTTGNISKKTAEMFAERPLQMYDIDKIYPGVYVGSFSYHFLTVEITQVNDKIYHVLLSDYYDGLFGYSTMFYRYTCNISEDGYTLSDENLNIVFSIDNSTSTLMCTVLNKNDSELDRVYDNERFFCIFVDDGKKETDV